MSGKCVDHVSICAHSSQMKDLLEFYEKALKPLGIVKMADYHVAVGFGFDGGDISDFWICQAPHGEKLELQGHIAFAAKDRATVRAFHAAALEAGAKDNGAPGTREMYSPTYYGAFIIDPIGHRIEAVCHKPE